MLIYISKLAFFVTMKFGIRILKVTKLSLPGLALIEPQVFIDHRGYFFENFNHRLFNQHIPDITFVQDNESFSHYGVLRGLHMQIGHHTQAKLVKVVKGKVLDVAVDLRPDSSNFGQYFTIELSSENKLQLFIPRGFAHGFLTLSKTAILQYKCDNYYYPDAERGINYADPDLAINWPINQSDIIINERDRGLPTLKEWHQAL